MPETREDGMPAGAAQKDQEWWVFDAGLDDVSTVVVISFPGPMAPLRKELAPMINIEFDRCDETSYKRDLKFCPAEFSAATDNCNVQIAHNHLRGNVEHCEIQRMTR